MFKFFLISYRDGRKKFVGKLTKELKTLLKKSKTIKESSEIIQNFEDCRTISVRLQALKTKSTQMFAFTNTLQKHQSQTRNFPNSNRMTHKLTRTLFPFRKTLATLTKSPSEIGCHEKKMSLFPMIEHTRCLDVFSCGLKCISEERKTSRINNLKVNRLSTVIKIFICFHNKWPLIE
jgi:DNA gyrase/topoisomerase IV subunit B